MSQAPIEDVGMTSARGKSNACRDKLDFYDFFLKQHSNEKSPNVITFNVKKPFLFPTINVSLKSLLFKGRAHIDPDQTEKYCSLSHPWTIISEMVLRVTTVFSNPFLIMERGR